MSLHSVSNYTGSRSSIDQYVRLLGGKHIVKRVLIANNGIAAVKAIRSIRRWSYETFGNEREVLFTVMATPEDLRANAEYIRMADSFVSVPGGPNYNNYANVALIVETACSEGADAVWAGWGHASENPALPNALAAIRPRPIVFIGPPAGPMYALGDKIGSTIIAQSAGVPVIAWNGQNLRTDYAKDGLPESLYAQADVKTAEDAQRLADEVVGYPLMIKASEGGGGKGIRKVVEPAALVASFRQVQAEVPGSPIFLMKLAPRARHLEVQLLADMYGQAIALFGRDCSVQRRHQKIVEEGPVLAAPRETWTKMERAAVTLAKAVGYVNAGTVEYLWMEDDGSFAFLELNPRLQVEHPVTEMVTNVNLPAAQLQVAMGIPLNCIPEIRRLYGRSNLYVDTLASTDSSVSIDFDTEARVEPQGHVIAARITAENPDVGFQPTAGEVSELNFRSTPDVWGYFSVDSSGRVHEYADSQIGHLFAWGGTREDARQHMVLALKELSIRGDIRTTTEYLVHMMESDDFRANRINTAWLDGRILDKVRVNKPDALLVAMIGAVWRAHVAHVTRRTDFIGCLERGQFPPPSLLSVKDDIELIYDSVKYTLHTTQSGPNTVTLMVNGTWLQADFRPLSDGGLLVSLGGRSHVVYAKEESSGLRLVLDGATCMFTNEYDPTQLRAAMSGKLSRFLVEDGTDLKAGQPYAEVEVMKMYMSLCIPESGRLFRVKPEGSVLESGDLIAKVELEDPSKVRKAAPFVGTLPQNDDLLLAADDSSSASEDAISISPTNSVSSSNSESSGNRYSRRWHILARNALKTLGFVLAGYVMPRDVYDRAWFDRDAAFAAPELALLEIEESMAALASRLPGRLVQSIQATLAAHKVALKEFKDSQSSSVTQASAAAAVAANPNAALRVFTNSSTVSLQLDVRCIEKTISEFLASPTLCPTPSTVSATAQPVRDICERFRDGVTGAGRASLLALLNEYMAVEKLFCQGRRMEDVVADLRATAGTNAAALAAIFETGRSHSQLKQRSVLVLSALARVAEEVEVNKNADKNTDNTVIGQVKGVVDGTIAAAATATVVDVNSINGNLPRGSFLSVSSRSLGDEASERGDIGEPHQSPLEDDEDADTLDITQPMQLGGKSTGKSSQTHQLHSTLSLPSSDLRAFKPVLHQLAELRGIEYSEVTLEARQILVVQQMPSQTQRRIVVEELLRAMGDASTSSTVQSLRDDSMLALIEDDQPLLDDLMSYFSNSDSLLQRNAAEVYVRRLYRLYSIRSLTVAETSTSPGGFLLINWTFKGGDGAGGSDSRLRAPTPGDLALELAAQSGSSVITANGVLPPLRKGGLNYFTESYVDLSSLAGNGAPTSPTASALTSSNEFKRISSTNDLSGASFSSPPLKRSNSTTNASAAATAVALYQSSLRRGMVAAFPSFEAFKENFGALLEDLRQQQLTAAASSNSTGAAATTVAAADELSAAALSPEAEARLSQAALNVMHVSILRSPASDSSFIQSQKRARAESAGVAGVSDALAEDEDLEKAVVDIITSALEPFKLQMLGAGLRRITFNVPNTRDSVDSRRRSSPTPLIDTAAAFVAEVTQAISPRQETQALRKLRSMGNINASVAVASISTSSTTGSVGSGTAKKSGGSINSAASTRQAGSLSGTFAHGLPWIYTFRSALGYKEDNIVRHIEPPASANLELKRLSNFRVRLVPTPNKVVHVYAAHARNSTESAGGSVPVRYFVRAIVRQTTRVPTLDSVYEQYPGPERVFVECLDALNIAMADAMLSSDNALPVGNNHIFLNVLPVATVPPEYIETVIKILAKRYADRLRTLRVSQVEFKIIVQAPSQNAQPIAIRLISSNPTGYVLRVDTYVESRDESQGVPIFTSIAPAAIGSGWWNNNSGTSAGLLGGFSADLQFNNGGIMSANGSPASLQQPLQTGLPTSPSGFLASVGLSSIGQHSEKALPSASVRGELDGKPVTTSYPVASPFERQRAIAAGMSDTIYVYDLIELMTRALEIDWSRYEKLRGGPSHHVRKPRVVLSAVELVMRRANSKSTGLGSIGASIDGEPTSSSSSATASLPGARKGMQPPLTPGSSTSANVSTSGGHVLIQDGGWELVEVVRPPGKNDIGMVAWKVTMFTPQYSAEEGGGREVMLISNDITFRAGSFGTAEDRLFNLASMYARKVGMPRVYFAANSGARIGLAEEVKKVFKAAWVDNADPSKGYKYLYLTESDYSRLCATLPQTAGEQILQLQTSSTTDNKISGESKTLDPPAAPVLVKKIVEEGEERYVITDIIGKEGDLGVENLRGSGTIAGETARAYLDSFTLTYVTGRTVGIGAYLVRLGQRCIQKASSAPIILTGFEALNKLMGSDVYTSNQQLGGPKVMYSNGVSHEIVQNDFEGVLAVLRWLSFVPRIKGAPLPVTDVVKGDGVDRDIAFLPPSTAYDPRQLIAGYFPSSAPITTNGNVTASASSSSSSSSTPSSWVSGMFDFDSWHESLSGWAKSVVVGRARLGGIPVGVIVPELRTTTAVNPADPASPASMENVVAQAGQVWFPDSAFKTAQAIRDFTGEDLPIFILANWRGFSGGQRDMFDEVLKYGSYIVDALVACKQPVFVYIPPGGELRGGAWVVVDPTINAEVMEMYSDPTGRGGVLEPAGTAAIKFRAKELTQAAHRLDPVLKSLDAKLVTAASSGLTSAQILEVKTAIRAREERLSSVYLQIGQGFADLHDTPGRMLSVGCINGVVPWKQARTYFYWRLRRRLAESAIVQRLISVAPQLGFSHASTLLRSWFFQLLASTGEGRGVGGRALVSTSSRPQPSQDGQSSVLEEYDDESAAVKEAQLWKDDVRVLRFLSDNRDVLEANVASLRKESIAEQVLSLGAEDAGAVVTGVLALIARLPPDRREATVAGLRRGIIFGGGHP